MRRGCPVDPQAGIDRVIEQVNGKVDDDEE
jgi:hypothetical protein